MSKVHDIKLYEKYLTEQPELVDRVIEIIVRCIKTQTKFCIQAPTGAGKTYFIKKLADRISKETGLNVRLAYPTNTLTNNQTDDKLNVRDLDAHYYENEFGEMVYDVAGFDTTKDLIIVDEMHNLISAISYRPVIISKIWDLPHVGGLSGTPEGLESLGVEIIKIERAQPVIRTITFQVNNKYNIETLAKYVADCKDEGTLLLIRHNSVNGLARIKTAILSKYKDFNIATVFSTSQKGRQARLEAMNKDISIGHNENTLKNIQKLNVGDSIDVVLGTQVLDEGLDLVVSENRRVQAYMLEPYSPHMDEETGKSIWYQSNTTPTSLVQFDARNRTGLQDTTVIAGFGDKKKPDYKDLTSIAEISSTKNMLDYAGELFSNTASYRMDDWKADVSQYNKYVDVQDVPTIKKVWSENQSTGELRKYICFTERYAEWESILIRSGNREYVECQTNELTQVTFSLKDKLYTIVDREIELALLNIPFKLFIDDNYLEATRDAIYDAYTIINDEREKGEDKRLLMQIMELKSVRLDLTDWSDISKTRKKVIKKLVNRFYKANRVWTNSSKSIELKPEFDKKKFTDKTSDDLFWEARKHLK